jgi:hypothetical protein
VTDPPPTSSKSELLSAANILRDTVDKLEASVVDYGHVTALVDDYFNHYAKSFYTVKFIIQSVVTLIGLSMMFNIGASQYPALLLVTMTLVFGCFL